MKWDDKHDQQFAAALALLVFSLIVSYYHYPSPEPLPKAVALNTLEPVKTKDPNISPTFDPSLIISTTTYSIPLVAPPTPKKVPAVQKTPAPQAKKPVVPTPKKAETKAEVAVTTQNVPLPSEAIVTNQIQPQPTTPAAPEQVDSLQTLRKSLVNILCTSHKSPLRGSTGTGIIIDSKGIILTVAHVAQSELLSDTLGPQVISCVIRTGNPARAAYTAKVIYISGPWLRTNSTTLISSQPTGTGENDFALLAITGSVNGSTPSSYPYVSLSEDIGDKGDQLGVGGYAAQGLSNSEIYNSLSASLTKGILTGIYTFTSTTHDVLDILGGTVARQGASGGGVVNDAGDLVGLITTSEISGLVETRHLRASTVSHIRRSFESDTGENFDSYFKGKSSSSLVANYSSKAQELGAFLANAIGFK